MKLTKIALAIAATLASAQAAVVTIDTGFTRGVVNNEGTSVAVGTGYIAIGFFSTIDDSALATSSAAQLAADFQVFGGDSAVFGKSGLAGFFALSADTGSRLGAADAFVGKNIYLVAFNGSSIESSSEALIYKFAETFVVDPAEPTPPSSQTPNFNVTDAGKLLVGSTGGTLTGPVAVPAAQMALLVPEPSVALLGLLGAFGLMRRRR